jgi:hypothetical protein
MNNPYDAPATTEKMISPGIHGTLEMSGKDLKVPIGTKLPPVCLLTGRVGTGKYIEKELVWAPSWVYIFILFNLLILLIVYLVTRKKGVMGYYLDNSIFEKRKSLTNKLMISVAVMISLIVVAALGDNVAWIMAPIIGLLVSFIIFAVKYPRISKIDKSHIYVGGLSFGVVDYLLSNQDAA